MNRFAMALAALTLALALASAGGTRAAEAVDGAILTPVNGFMDATDKGDIKTASRFWGPSQSVVDQFSPYHWSGPGALKAWWAGFLVASKQGGQTEVMMTRSAAPYVEHSARHAYVTVPVKIDFKAKGQAEHLEGVLTFALDRTAARGWKIAAFSWAGGRQTP